MAELIRTFDWASTPLGPSESWPTSLRSVVDLLLSCSFPMVALWGPELAQVYNDGYAEIMAAKHPTGLGQPTRECWPEVWEFNLRIYDRVRTGETITLENQLFPITRHGYLEDAYFTLCYSPLRDETGEIAGVLVTVFETTRERLGTENALRIREARQRFLLQLSDAVRPISDPIQIQNVAVNLLGEALKVDRCYYVEIDRAARTAVVTREYLRSASYSLVGTHPIELFETLITMGEGGKAVVCDDIAVHAILSPEADAYSDRGVQAFVVALLVKGGAPVAFMCLTMADPRQWNESEVELLSETAERTWAAVERARAESDLAKSEEKYRTLFNSMDEGVETLEIIFDERENAVDLIYLEANPAFTKMTGITKDVTGKRILELFPQIEQHWLDLFGRVARTGEAERFEEYVSPVERWFSAFVSRVGGQGSRRVAVVFNDTTERKRTEKELRDSENRLTVALQAARLGSWELDLQSMHMQCSALCKSNYGRSTELPFEYEDLQACIHPDDLPKMQLAVQTAIREREVYRAEYRVYWPDGSLHWIVASGQAILDAYGAPQRMVGVTLDVTERHLAADAIIRSEKLAAVGRLSASIAHEINNPLESVTNLLYLARTSAEPEDVKNYIVTAERELQRASAITNQTLRFHKQASSPKAITSEELIEGVLAIYQGKIVNSDVTVERQDFAVQPIFCFEGEIRQVLSNLIGNALDAMGKQGGRLVLRSREVTDWRSGKRGVGITVADTGEGMSVETLKRLFEPFYTTKGFSGTGLGLWVSHEIVSRHRGQLRVRSTRQPNRCGTVFTLFLPFDAVSRQ